MKDIRIVVVQRGWIFVGEYERAGNRVLIHRAKNIRTWGTERGLGQLAADGPTSNTCLDEAGDVDLHMLSEVFTLRCNPEKWDL